MKADLLDGVRLRVTPDGDDEPLVAHEWLVTNGLGGYASASVASLATRKYHGLLVAALPNPLGRIAMLNHVVETVVLGDGRRVQLSGDQRRGQKVMLPGIRHLRSFRLDAGLPVWEFDLGKAVLERRVVMPHRQNTTYLIYRLVGGEGPVRLELRPGVHFRNYEQDVGTPMQLDYALERTNAGAPGEDVYALTCTDAPATLRLQLTGSRATYHPDVREITELHYRVEEDRGYAFEGRLWTPGVFSVDVGHGATSTLVASAESAETMLAMTGDDVLAAEMERRRRLLRTAPTVVRADAATAELVLAADQFLITPAGRRRDAARAIAEGDEIRSVIAGYHWFTDWGRDTMISLEGLTLSTGRVREAGSILRTFAHYVRDGLLPNMFPDGSNEGLYHTADATLWFYHAVDRYLTLSGDEVMLERLLPTMIDIAEHHLRGTRFGIGVDSADGLVRQGAEGYQLTWMDAKVDGWVVTPRRGKAVEINALWYNALCVLGRWVSRVHGDEAARPWGEHAARARASFNERFWYGEGGYLYDVIDGPNGDSIECRPNQLFAISLPNPVLDRPRWESVMRVIEERLVTPVGLRSLAPGSPNYAPRYFGNLRARDAAYHQGTVWGWLIGPWIDAWRKLHPGDPAGARRWLDPLIAHVGEFGVGSIAEIFDAEPPYTPRGCIAQAWSVAEVLRQMVAAGQTREMQLTAEEPT
jgi:predicted glycogen debranching enzyme